MWIISWEQGWAGGQQLVTDRERANSPAPGAVFRT
jgi:hypothetical protein